MKKLLCLVLLSAGILDANELESKCNKGKFETCVDLGMQHYNNKDYVKAKDLWIKACDDGSVGGCFNLGALYYNGQGVRQDKKIAKEYFGKACDLGEQKGCDNYRMLNEQGY